MHLSPKETPGLSVPRLPKPKQDLALLLAQYEEAKALAIDRLTAAEQATGLDLKLAELKAVQPLKRMKLRFVRDAIDNAYNHDGGEISATAAYLVDAWMALHNLSLTHSAYFAAYQEQNKDTTQ